MSAIKWEDAEAVYEAMVSVLLSNVYPEAQRIDGNGGDGGRDVQLRSESRLDLFELKKFTGRVGNEKSRRAQVESSLKRAAELQPDSWSLVVPIDPNPSELKWFDGLRAKYPFPLYWLGKDWLDRKMSKYVRVRRYFLEDGANEAIRLLREVAAERAGLGRGIQAVLDRVQLLAEQLEDLEPYYRVNISVGEDCSSIDVVPRYIGAENERPIYLTGRLALPVSPIGQELAEKLRNSVRYGDEVEIPAEFTSELALNDDIFGLSQLVAGSRITIGAAEEESVRFAGRLKVRSSRGSHLASLSVVFSKRRKGEYGARLFGADSTGSIKIELRFDLDSSMAAIGLHFQQKSDLLPGSLIAVLRFVQHLCYPNEFALEVESNLIGEWRELTEAKAPAGPEYLELIERLDFVQRESQAAFGVPDQFTGQDVKEVEDAFRYFRDEEVHIPSDQIVSNVHMRNLAEWESWILNGDLMQVLFVTVDQRFSIAGVEVPAGRSYVYAAPARVLNGEWVLAQRPWTEDRAVQVKIRVEEGGSLYVKRVGSGADL